MSKIEVQFSGGDEYPKYLRLLVAGAPGSGKTTLGARMPNPVVANFGSNLTTLGHMGNIPFVNVVDEKTLHGLKLALDRDPAEREQLFGRPIDTLVIDTVDTMQRMLMESRLERENRTETDVSDWGWVAQRLHKICKGLSELDLNIVYLSHLKDVSVNERRTILKPAIGGAFCEGIHEYVNHSMRLHAVAPEPDEIDVPPDFVVDDEGQILFSAMSASVSRWLDVWPTNETEWCHDKTGTLPRFLPVTPDLFSVINGLVHDVSLVTSHTLTVDTNQTTPTEEPSEATEVVTVPDLTEYVCDSCNTTFDEKVWVDLSRMKFKQTLCGNCFKTQDKG
jgi:hypothetical protein